MHTKQVYSVCVDLCWKIKPVYIFAKFNLEVKTSLYFTLLYCCNCCTNCTVRLGLWVVSGTKMCRNMILYVVWSGVNVKAEMFLAHGIHVAKMFPPAADRCWYTNQTFQTYPTLLNMYFTYFYNPVIATFLRRESYMFLYQDIFI